MELSIAPGLRDGIRLAQGRDSAADLVTVACASYGHLFLASDTRSWSLPPWDETDVEEGLEAELLMAWWEQAARVDRAVTGPDEPGTLGGAAYGASRLLLSDRVRAALDALSGSRYFGYVSDRMLIFALKQVRRYMTEPELRSAAQAQVAALVSDDTRVLVGHSLGSVVAYEALCAHPKWPVTDLITLGSPLGIRRMIFDRLDPSPVQGVGVWPGGVRRWTNIADPGDIVALVDRLADRFGARVQDHRITNGVRMHDLLRYLTAVTTGRTVAEALSGPTGRTVAGVQ
ncbi:alpha/beta hydrolase family protein [Streptomyces davaonensis]|uniref:antibiotic ABC transporter ATP-binding protein n=1 Tax=Streptomyces davaonensis TaxID=348043 RepID=UPI001E52BCCA|nr:antibiotic ABC transporter ATP-binding protein [Streptomyces davaonensis]